VSDEPNTFTGYRISWRMIAIAVLAVLIVVFGVLTLKGPRRIVAIVPAGGDQVAVLQTDGGGDRVLRVDLGQGDVWATDIPTYKWKAAHAGASAGGPAFTLRTQVPDESIRTTGYDWATGEKRWEAADSGIEIKAAVPPWVTTLADDATVYELHMTRPHTLFAVDRATGTERWKASMHEEWSDADEVVRGWLRPGQVLLDEPDTLALFDRATGEVDAIRTRRAPCVLADRVIYEPEDASTLISRSLTDGSQLVGDDLPGNLAGECGVRGNAVVIEVEEDFRGRLEWRDAATLAPIARLDLAPWALVNAAGRENRNSYPDQVPMSGVLGRFVPIEVVDWKLDQGGTPGAGAAPTAAGHGLVMIDTDAHAIAWAAENPALSDWSLVADGGRAYLVRGSTIAAFDTATGEVTRAVRIKEAEPIQAYHLRDGRIWIFRWDAVGALDATTLEVLPGSWSWLPFEVEDATAEVKAMLGRP
jgi:outer membrane protein assembly factor BamB